MPYHIDEENSELAFEVREGNKLVIKIKSNIFSDSLELYLIKVGDNTEPTDKNVFSSLRVLKEIENLHDTILKEINSVTSGFWELKQDSQGNEYIATKYNVLTEGGLTTYGLGEQKLGTIYDGLPIDNDTIYWEEVEGSRVLKAKGSGGGSTGLDETKLWNVLGTPGDQQIDYSHLRSAFSQFSNEFVTINTEQEITALKHFTAGLSIGSAKKKIYEKDGVLYIDSNVAITGALTMYATDGQSVSSIYDGLPIDNDTIYWGTVEGSRVLKAKGGSSFDENAMWSALSGSSDNQINKSHLTTALDGYATQNWVIENYATKSELSAVSDKLNDFLEGSDTDEIINKWKELEAFLSGMAETDNLAEILETKADKKYVDSTFVTLATKQTITGEKTFSSVLNTAAIKASGEITTPSLAASDYVTIAGIKLRKLEDGALMLEGNLALTGALTMYASNGQSFDTIYDGLPIDNDTIYWQEVDGSRVLKAREGSGSSFDKSAMWAALSGSSDNQINKSHLTTALDGYATQNWVIENYATKSELSAVSDKLNDFLEGSDTDEIINKWKELEAFLSGMAETDNLAEILETKADKKYVDSTFVTLATKQTITGEKTFSSVLNTAAIKASGEITTPSLAASDYVTIAGIKLRKLEDGALMLEGNLALTGALTMYASNGQSFDTIYDGLPIDNDTIYWQEVDGSRVLKAREGSGSSFDKSAMWAALEGATTEQINKTHLTTALNGYATESWVTSKNYLTSVSIATISDLHANWDALLKAAPSAYVTRWPTISEVTDRKNLIIKLNGGSTEGTNLFTYNVTGEKTINITPAGIGAAASSHNHSWSNITSGKPTTLAGYGITDAYTKTESDNRYLNVSGGDTIQGLITINHTTLDNSINIVREGSNSPTICFSNKTNGQLGRIGFNNEGKVCVYFKTSSDESYVWHSTNGGAGSGLDADLLDGTHKSGLLTALTSSSGTNISITVGGTTKSITDLFANSAAKLETARTLWGQSFDGTKNITGRFTSNERVYADKGIWVTNNDIAAWGQSNAALNLSIPNTSNTSGIICVYRSGKGNTGYTRFFSMEISNSSDSVRTYYANEVRIDITPTYMDINKRLNINGNTIIGSGGNLGIGTANPAAKLHVIGDILATGGGTYYGSDIRYKSIMQQVNLSLLDIAKAPSFVYRWNKKGMKRDRLNLGGSAQYTQLILPWAVEENDNFLSMDYATVAYTFAVHTARHLLTYESRTDKKIKKLENRVKYLEKQLKKLGYEEVRTLDDQSV